MQVNYRPTVAEINLEALEANYSAFRHSLPIGMKLLACVKANAYGHGAVQVAREMERLGADYLSVAFLDEALELRNAGIRMPILVLGYVPPYGIQTAWEQDITISLFSEEVLGAIRELDVQDSTVKLKVHIKVDSGMGRLGLLPGERLLNFIQRAVDVPHLEVEGLFTHFATADEHNKEYTLEQYRRFQGASDALREQDIKIPIIHTGNSAVAVDMPQISCDMIRIGIALYGLYPSAEVNTTRIQLRPVLTLKTQIVFVKTLPPNSGISYGVHYVTTEEERIGTLPIGYADGFSRLLGGKVQVLIRGRRVPVVGTICMDQCMVTLQAFAEEAEDIQAGEEVVLIGSQSAEVITADEVASHMGTIHYEVVCMLAHRVPRRYIRSGITVDIVNPIIGSI
ncbi:alanine racemase [Paenibacillus shirakamiensis]|uniref:Alanine racemase n=1 Tax=Paenibacillus shirakamiensis TaxID=1265935 RepID=A0ABS4JFS7_9BACL|nr:alanine racemase [Paenibacillus shirakamiensis]MBP2000577.1 alanine racemase [Paenibacillus shirakamiensis]